MTLEEIRVEIDAVDTQMKPLFLKRMECAKNVAQVKAQTGGDVFVLERELAIIEKRAGDVDQEIYAEYVAFLRHLMSVSRRCQYGILKGMQDSVLNEAEKEAGIDETIPHAQVEIHFTCPKATSDLNLYINMAKLNSVEISEVSLKTEEGVQKVNITLDGNLKEEKMRRLLCQIGKEADNFHIAGIK